MPAHRTSPRPRLSTISGGPEMAPARPPAHPPRRRGQDRGRSNRGRPGPPLDRVTEPALAERLPQALLRRAHIGAAPCTRRTHLCPTILASTQPEERCLGANLPTPETGPPGSRSHPAEARGGCSAVLPSPALSAPSATRG